MCRGTLAVELKGPATGCNLEGVGMSPSSRFAAVLERLPGVRGWQENFYRDLHAHPELSHQESATAVLA